MALVKTGWKSKKFSPHHVENPAPHGTILLYHPPPDMQIDNLLTTKVRLPIVEVWWVLCAMVVGVGLAMAEEAAAEQPSDHHPLEDIYTQVQDFLLQDQQEGDSFQLIPLDSRLRLKACAEPLDIRYQRNRSRSGQVVVEVRCRATSPWRVYLRARVERMREVVVSIAPTLKDEPVEMGNLQVALRDLSRLRQGYFETPDQLKGMYARKVIQGGEVLTPQLLYIPNLINKGDQVLIQIQRGELRVQMDGEAIEDGARDSKIRVRNHSSGKVVEGVAVAPGRVLVAQ